MLSWVLRHRHQLRALYGLPPEPALAKLIEHDFGREDDASVERPRRGLPQVVLSPARRRA
jgi:hypothetical protein